MFNIFQTQKLLKIFLSKPFNNLFSNYRIHKQIIGNYSLLNIMEDSFRQKLKNIGKNKP
jgi:hypothetical protein